MIRKGGDTMGCKCEECVHELQDMRKAHALWESEGEHIFKCVLAMISSEYYLLPTHTHRHTQ